MHDVDSDLHEVSNQMSDLHFIISFYVYLILLFLIVIVAVSLGIRFTF